MNEHTLVYTLFGGWTPVGGLAAGPHIVLTAWGWVERYFTAREPGPAWYTADGNSASEPLAGRRPWEPWDPTVERDRKLGCLHRLGKFSVSEVKWHLPTQDMVDLAVRLATDCGVRVHYKTRLGFEAELLPKFARPAGVTYDFDVGANLLKFGLNMDWVRGPDAVKYESNGPVLTRQRFTTGSNRC